MKKVSRFFRENSLEIAVCLVVVDRECDAEKTAYELGIDVMKVDLSYGFDDLKSILIELNPDFVVTNVHRILPVDVINLSPSFLNLHYSILPAFKGVIGMKGVIQGRLMGSALIGATCHVVSEHVDSGEILAQGALAVGESEKDDIHKVFELGWRLLVVCIAQLCGVDGVKEVIGFDNLNAVTSISSK